MKKEDKKGIARLLHTFIQYYINKTKHKKTFLLTPTLFR